MTIDWTDPKAKVSKYFSVYECLHLPQWNRMATEDDGLTEEIKTNLIQLCEKMDQIHEFFGKPVNVHVTFRPKGYNALIGGAKNSAHLIGKAMDFDIPGLVPSDCRQSILTDDLLEKLDMRLEQGTPTWIHLDTAPVISSRYFKP